VNNFEEASSALGALKKLLANHKHAYFNSKFSYYKGVYFALINQQQLAISNFLSADKIAIENRDLALRIKIKQRISSLYQSKRSFKHAEKLSKEAVQLSMKTSNKVIQTKSLLMLASLTRLDNNPNQSLIYLFNALELVEKSHCKDLVAHIFLELGKSYGTLYSIDYAKRKKNTVNKSLAARNNNLRLAQKYLQSARIYFRSNQQTTLQLESLLLLSHLNIRNQEPALAILQLEKVLALSNNKYPLLRMRAFEMLALSYELTGDPNRAIFHFKNFHALQNKIKQHQFRLQQLQINEHLRLYEETQNQKKLEEENNKLQIENTFFSEQIQLFKALASICFLAVVFLFYRNKKLIETERKATKKLSQHGRSKLITQYAPSAIFNSSYKGEPLFYGLVYVPFLSKLNIKKGYLRGANLEYRLGLALNKYLGNETITYHIRDNQILFVSEQALHRSSEEFALKIEQFFITFADKYRVSPTIAIGVAQYPFLPQSKMAITTTRMFNINSLALYGALQILKETKKSCWVELVAIDNLQPAFLDGDLWVQGKAGINTGVIKVKSSNSEYVIDWS
jgi:hypothetical protein